MNRKILWRIRMFLALMVLVASCASFSVSASEVSNLRLNRTSVTLTVGKKTNLKVKGKPRKANVRWSSENKKIAVVNKNGKVTAKKAGTTKITAKVGKKKLICKVKVKNVMSADQETQSPEPAATNTQSPEPAVPNANNVWTPMYTTLSSGVICYSFDSANVWTVRALPMKLSYNKDGNLVADIRFFNWSGNNFYLKGFYAKIMDANQSVIAEGFFAPDVSLPSMCTHTFTGIFSSAGATKQVVNLADQKTIYYEIVAY